MNYHEIIYKNIYSNIDLAYYTKDNGLKYDFIVHKGGDPNDIRLSCAGIDDLFIDSNEDLRIHTTTGDIVDSEIFIYQNINNKPLKIDGRFKILNRNTFGFEILSEYDRGMKLIIDPMVYSTYIGSTSFDGGYDIEVDSNGSAYVTGYTDAANFPCTAGAYDTSYNGNYDVFVIKLNHNGSNLLYSTFIGGTNSDQGRCLKLDDNGSIYVGGITNSNNFPTTLNAYDTANNGAQDCFVLKLEPLGNGINDLNYSTYLGGSSLDYCHDIALNDSNNIYITGETQSDSDFPATIGAYQTTHQGGILDAYFAIINPEGNGTSDLVYSTHLGGSTASMFVAQDMGYGITVDASGNAYITGTTYSSDFPTTAGAYNTSITGWSDGFITKINPAGNGNSDLIYSTYFGGTNMQESNSIDLDSSNNAVVVGRTTSSDFPTTPNAYDTSLNIGNGGDIFVLKLDPAGNGANDLKYSTYIGSTDDDWGFDVVVDDFGDAYIIGHSYWQTPPSGFPTTANAFDDTHNGQWDVVVVKLGLSGGNLSYSSFIGGGLTDFGYGIAIDSELKMYATGYCSGPDFPNTTGAFDQTFNGGWQDAFACKLEFNNVPHVLDLNVSTHSVFRTQKIYLDANATDIEDIEHNLTPHFEYR
ncbi:MAG: SBBP repeat-containing protein, partial [Thermoplasmata archaeon]|nr:SBBP repeat-containing protein [Thermoplasmata archaeon]